MTRKIPVTVLVVGLVVLVILGMAVFWPQVPPASALASPAAPPTRLVCYGYVDSQQGQMLLQPARAGRVVQVFIKEKQLVSKDTPLVQLDDRQVKLLEQEATLAVEAAQTQLTKARSGLLQYQAKRAQAEAALEVAQIKFRRAEHTWTVTEQLHKDGFAGQGYLDVVQDQQDEARALIKAEQNKLSELKAVNPELEVKLAELQLNRYQAQLERARQDREEYLLRAPVGGLVLRIQTQEGDLIGPTSPRPAVWLVPEGAWIVRAEVSQEFAGGAQEGLVVQVEDEGSASLLAKGTIVGVSDWFLPRRQFSALPSGVNTGLSLECMIELQEKLAPLRLGQRVRVRILASQPTGERLDQPDKGRR
jgi:HlyD family secretion protein